MSRKIALVLGGANGLGAALVEKLNQENYEKIYIVDRCEPEIAPENSKFIRFNLISDDFEALEEINLEEIDTLTSTAGVRRLDYFQNLTKTQKRDKFKN